MDIMSELHEAGEIINRQRADLARVTAERDAAIAEVGKIGRQLGKAQAENDRLRESLANIASHDVLLEANEEAFSQSAARRMQSIADFALKQGD